MSSRGLSSPLSRSHPCPNHAHLAPSRETTFGILNSFSTSSSAPSLMEYAGTASTFMSVLRVVLMFVMGIGKLSRLLLLNSRCLSLPALMVTVLPSPGMCTPSMRARSFCSVTLSEDECREISPPWRLLLFVPLAEAKVELDFARMNLIAGPRVGIAAAMRMVLCSKEEA